MYSSLMLVNLRCRSNCNVVLAIDVYASINIKQMDRIAPLITYEQCKPLRMSCNYRENKQNQ